MSIAPEMWEPLPKEAERPAESGPVQGFWAGAAARLVRHKPAMAGLVFIVVLITAAIFGPAASPWTYFEQDLELSNLPPVHSPYRVGDQRVFVNSGNLGLYEVGEDGSITALIRPDERDMINRRSIWAIDGREVVLDYSVRPAILTVDGAPAEQEGRTLNRAHPFGTDQLGRDVLVRQLYGARISLMVAAAAVLTNFVIGVLYGGISGYLGGRVDTVMMRIVEIVATIPLTLYVILMMVVLQSGLWSVILAIGSVYWVDMARIVRGQILTLKAQDYVAAARTMGAPTSRILFRHLLPNAFGPILVTLTMLIPSAIFIESFMSFIGLGVTPPQASWGTLTSEAVETLRTYPHQLFFPALAISLTMLAFNFLGDGLRDALDPRLSQ
ncbi:ABC transporter permease [Pelagovum pacificum]|uniref:ABC transporter permease n=1 Tax=Pelagovum pacificum TaxID=2588711 RepID=A0A5C5GHV9_9RHOB|nr:ABC transporter permease [Pelagovum pacificum]QQA43834.1 ABC transporter permease [Pelagovum pacificum]TNY33036.1 ABC transporter permease [Pelagovum pacificum]